MFVSYGGREARIAKGEQADGRAGGSVRGVGGGL